MACLYKFQITYSNYQTDYQVIIPYPGRIVMLKIGMCSGLYMFLLFISIYYKLYSNQKRKYSNILPEILYHTYSLLSVH